ncbi:rhodanese-like domain-containing protein [Maritalea mediterranea]|uniref:Rhodanese-like domain-containing protein n=1 Tax=Maritalea mediterranea TaxID=2909667 RepID=A0ABS9E6N5_9HYPH|nr:rhodanese-like domain-containing protein [Maritalea mediterranea]MCF4098531.1 rhodanese-like domain-containing protein [Maritalea mediterranea]
MKTAKDYLDEASKVVERIDVEQAKAQHGQPESVFIDVRDSAEIEKSGTVEGALRIPRGFIEFAADPDTPFYDSRLTKDTNLYLLCGAGGQAALAGKTLKEMGYKSVTNIGGFKDWKEAGGPVEGGQ